jgi:hypothetical protein
MATFNLIKDRVCQTTGFVSTFATPMADKNPRPWMLAGEAGDEIGMVLESTAALVPGALLPVSLAACVTRVFSGSMKGAAMANIDPRQAVSDNLGELRAKNGNQGFMASLLGSLAGLAALKVLTPVVGAMAPTILAAGAAVVGVFAMSRLVSNLDYHPVNDQAVHRIVDSLENHRELAGPEKKQVWRTLLHMLDGNTLTLGQDIRPLLDDVPRFQQLKELYRGRNYMLEVRDGKPYIVLREGCAAQDRFTAALQAEYANRFKESPDYKKLAAEDAKKADQWLVASSLQKTPADPRPLLEKLGKAGWSVDLLRFYDTGNRSRWGDLGEPAQYEMALPQPQPKAKESGDLSSSCILHSDSCTIAAG